jgi:hypothetical protein
LPQKKQLEELKGRFPDLDIRNVKEIVDLLYE